MSVTTLVLSLALAARLSPAPTAPSSRKPSEWSAYNKARAEAGLLPRKAARGTTQVSPSLVRDLPATAMSLDAAPPVRVVEPTEGASAGPAVAAQPVPPAAAVAPEPARVPRVAVEEPPPLRRPTATQRQVLDAVRRASAAAAVERSARADAVPPPAAPEEPARAPIAPVVAAGQRIVEEPVVAAQAPLIAVPPAAAGATPVVAEAVSVGPPPAPASPAPAPAWTEPPRVAVRERSRAGGAQLDAEGGALLAGLQGAKVELRVVARVGSMTVAVERPEIALR
ncbi:hypothetical protein [Anaeromyxobacter oryzae]|uniref:Uncharacterized protein n=1 Tax=Anaeromyxobacter oryzae TaxID=2918170 RepID=A0ABM7WNS4_9BACT|nr:hypothetical protein [Anaeromyxobacter oryzae]BDG01106.1 hypothetical protein AMOR_01020 [Anaeromyxobacter oryzae]